MSSLYELLCHQTDLTHSPNTFIFILTTKDYEIFYGVCVRKDESVEHYPSFIKKEENSSSSSETSVVEDIKKSTTSSSTSNSSITIAPRCYVLVSRFPFFQLFFEVLHGILSMEHVYQITQPYIQPHRNSADDTSSNTIENVSLLQKNALSTSTKKTPGFQNEYRVEEKKEIIQVGDALQVLQKFYKLVIPNPGQPVEFKLSNTKTIHFSRSVIDEEDEALREWGLTLAIHTIPKKHFFTMVNAFILEKKVAFVSQNLRILSSVVLSFLTLVRPFIYQSAVIPILPLKMMSLLEAPVPFIVGITQMPDKIPTDVIILNLDDGILHQHIEIPELPRFKPFDEFPALYSELKKTWIKDEKPYVPTSKQLRLSKRIAQLWNRSLTSMFETFRQHCITDMSEKNLPVTIFIKESFLETVNPEYLPWYSTMVETQMFFNYVDNRLRKMDRKPIV